MSWPLVKLGDIFEIARGGSPRPIDDYFTEEDDGLNWVSIKDASESEKYIYSTQKKIKPAGLNKTREVKPGDFLLTNSMSFGRPYIMKTHGCIHDGWLLLRGNPRQIDQDYFYHLLGSDLIFKKFSSLAAGAVVKNLNSDLVRNVEVPLPPLKEQKRIAAILDKADAIRRRRQQAIKLADEFLRSVFLDMFGDPVTNPKGFKKAPITELTDVITGFAFKSNEYISDSPDAVRLCRGTNTLTGYFDWSETAYWPKHKLEKLNGYLIKAGDIILAMDRPWISSGLKVCVYPKNQRDTYLVQRVARLRPRQKFFTDYIYGCIKSQAFERHCCPTETTVPHISPVELKSFEVLLPDSELIGNYHSIVSTVNNGLNKMVTSESNIEDMFFALSLTAFSGKIKSEIK